MKNIMLSTGEILNISERMPDFMLHPDTLRAAKEIFQDAEIIFGTDQHGQDHLFWGKALMRKITNKGEGKECKVLHIPIDTSPEYHDLEWLAAAVTTHRGACCYPSEG